MKELGKKQNIWFNRIETNYSHFLLTLKRWRCNFVNKLQQGQKAQLDHGGLESKAVSQ